MKILCHVGPWCLAQFKTIAEGFEPSANVRFVSGFRKLDKSGLVDSYYKYVNSVELKLESDQRDEEVILRCRLMRTLPKNKAERHVSAMRRAIKEMLLRESPDVFICESIDQYLHDLLFQEVERLSIPSYGLIRTFVNGYFRISTRGEMQLIREPDALEVNSILLKLLDSKYIPENLVPLKKNLFWTYLRIYLSNNVRVFYFGLLRWLSLEPYNYHYWSSFLTTKNSYRHLIPKISFGDMNWRLKLSRSDKLIIFIPLQHVPEATVDYWTEDVEMIDYQSRLIAFITSLSSDFQILVKEHPGVWGFRKPSFYSSIIQANSSLIVCPIGTPVQECIAASNAVLVWTGSVGLEAALRGMPVLTICSPYYASGSRFKKITLKTTNNEINDFIRSLAGSLITLEDQNAMVRHLLRGIMTGLFKNDGNYDASNESDIADARHIGRYLRKVHDQNIS